MVHISVLSSAENKKLTKLISHNIMRDFSLINLATLPIKFHQNNNRVVILSSGNMQIDSNISRDILVLDNFINQKIDIVPSTNSVAIISSDNKFHRDFVLEKSLPTITYGFLSKDTVTISSNDENMVVLSLGRDIVSVFNKVVEPFDFPLSLQSEASIYNIMAGFCVSILLENYENYSLI